MTRAILLISTICLLSGCYTVVRCGPGTIAVPDGIDPDGAGFLVAQDGDNYVDGNGDRYDDVTCMVVAPVTICGANTAPAPPVPGDAINPDGGGFFINQDGPGVFVAQDDSVPPQQVCVLAEPADS